MTIIYCLFLSALIRHQCGNCQERASCLSNLCLRSTFTLLLDLLVNETFLYDIPYDLLVTLSYDFFVINV